MNKKKVDTVVFNKCFPRAKAKKHERNQGELGRNKARLHDDATPSLNNIAAAKLLGCMYGIDDMVENNVGKTTAGKFLSIS